MKTKPSDAEILCAIDRSIKHHKSNLEIAHSPFSVKLGGKYCALCELFVSNDCMECPIYVITTRRFCHQTPYINLINAFEDYLLGKCGIGTFVKAEEKEVEFLKRVRETFLECMYDDEPEFEASPI